MGKTSQADIPDNKFTQMFNVASTASDAGASKRVLFEAPADLLITEVAFIPDGGDQGGATATYRDLKVLDGGAAGSGVALAATKRVNATGASLAPIDFTVTSSLASIDAGDIVLLSKGATAGGDSSDTVVQSGMLRVSYREL